MTTYVLVHGAWGGAHGWRLVRRRLAAAGHEVFTPSLTGIGERAHLASPTVDLGTHVWDVVNTIRYEDLSRIVLVGFSYGGMVVAGATEHVADRIAHLVFVDAFVPGDGDSVASLTQNLGGALDDPREPGTAWLVPPRQRAYDDPAEGAFHATRRVSQPIGCFLEEVRLSRPLEERGLPLTYVKATGEPRPTASDAFWDADDRARASAAWSRHGIDTNHMIPANRPDELVAVLLDL